MTPTLIYGIISATILISGAAVPPSKTKKILFGIGNVMMFIYALLNHQEGGSFFFVLLESLILISTVLMFTKISDRNNTIILALSGLGFIIWSLFLFENYTTILFIVGLTILGLGFAFKNGTLRKEIALMIGSIILGIFSYLDSSWLFVYINVFFILFSGYYIVKILKSTTKKEAPTI